MQDIIRDIILANLDRADIMQALESYVVDYLEAVNMEAIVEYMIDGIDIADMIVEVASEMLLPF